MQAIDKVVSEFETVNKGFPLRIFNLKMRPSKGDSSLLQPSKENIQHFKT
jgi:hypothetical protein